jgi:hypothetical protein
MPIGIKVVTVLEVIAIAMIGTPIGTPIGTSSCREGDSLIA